MINQDTPVGISGMAAYLPPYRVNLEHWCSWTGESWDKIRSVVGGSFRLRGADENAYTMAANAVLRLIDQYDVDPASVGYLGLGTESSTDNSAGAVIVKGMVNARLKSQGRTPLARACEVPEFKHACLGGVYALKGAGRYLRTDGRGRRAIVVASDVAEYERASSGEPTQGAGAVAMLVEEHPRLLHLELAKTGSASDYRGPDFRKPLARFCGQPPTPLGQPRDFPVFNGKYSTTCYLDEVLAAARDLYSHLDERPAEFFDRLDAVFLHRPYQRMAESGVAASYLLALATGNADDLARLAGIAAAAGLDPDALVAELTTEQDLYGLVLDDDINAERYPLVNQAIRGLRGTELFEKLNNPLGVSAMQEVGNLYTASLPAWLAAGLDDAARGDAELSQLLALGYGSGDAAEAIPLKMAEGWRDAAGRIDFSGALAGAHDLDQVAYEALHGGLPITDLPAAAASGFRIDGIGDGRRRHDDAGIERYRYVESG